MNEEKERPNTDDAWATLYNITEGPGSAEAFNECKRIIDAHHQSELDTVREELNGLYIRINEMGKVIDQLHREKASIKDSLEISRDHSKYHLDKAAKLRMRYTRSSKWRRRSQGEDQQEGTRQVGVHGHVPLDPRGGGHHLLCVWEAVRYGRTAAPLHCQARDQGLEALLPLGPVHASNPRAGYSGVVSEFGSPGRPRCQDRAPLRNHDSSGFGLGARDDETIDHFLLGQSRQLALRNLSSPGWSPEQYYAAYLKYAERFLPTHVYMLITHLNDFVIMESCTAFNRLKPTVAMDAKQQPVGLVRPGDMLRFHPVASDYVANLRLFYRAGRVLEPHYLRKLCGTTRPYGMLGNYDVDRLEIYSATEDAKGASDPIWKRFDFVVEEASRKARWWFLRCKDARLSQGLRP